MERKCEYCQELFIPDRKDKRHCSDSCRQMAYVRRKQSVNNPGQKNQKPSIDVFHQDHETSSHQEKTSISQRESVNKNEKPLIDGLTDQDKTSTKNDQNLNSEGKASVDVSNQNNETSINVTGSVNNGEKPSIDGFKKSSDPSTENGKSVNNNEKASIDTLKNVNETSTLSVNQSEEASTSDEKTVNYNWQKPSIDVSRIENNEVQSSFVLEMNELFSARYALQDIMDIHAPYSGGKPVGWISVRFRCILECLLTLSEMKEIEPDDLKEVCNALIAISASNHFKMLTQHYPYGENILELKELLKSVCMKIKGPDRFRFRLNRETKIKLMILRSELAMYFPKRTFKQLEFRQR